MEKNCVFCKGRYPRKYCGKDYCPILEKINSPRQIMKSSITENFSGKSPSIFVGRSGYPNLNVGVLGVFEDSDKKSREAVEYDSPSLWASKNMDIEEVISIRSRMMNSLKKCEIKKRDSYIEQVQEIAMSDKPPETEFTLESKPVFRIKASFDMAPYGPQAKLKKMSISENTKIKPLISKYFSDTDMHSVSAMNELFSKGIDETRISRLLSAGVFGLKKNRKLVPTRWSITATDDSLGKKLIEKIKTYPVLDSHEVFFGGYSGNYFLALVFPEIWSYELFEMNACSQRIQKPDNFTHDFEFYDGRKDYAEECAGGYYAARLSVLEALDRMKKQASVILLRFITNEYYIPLGVWVVREAVRKTMNSHPIDFSTRELMLNYSLAKSQKSFLTDVSGVIKSSKIYEKISKQKKLNGFFKT